MTIYGYLMFLLAGNPAKMIAYFLMSQKHVKSWVLLLFLTQNCDMILVTVENGILSMIF